MIINQEWGYHIVHNEHRKEENLSLPEASDSNSSLAEDSLVFFVLIVPGSSVVSGVRERCRMWREHVRCSTFHCFRQTFNPSSSCSELAVPALVNINFLSPTSGVCHR